MKKPHTTHRSLAAADLFAGLGPEEIAALDDVALLRQYVARENIFRLGDEARTLLVIGSGTVSLTIPVPINGHVDDVVLEEKEAGSVIAWSALVPPHRFSLGATALTDVELHCFDRDMLAALFDRHPHLHLHVIGNLNRVIASRVLLLEAMVARDVQRWVMKQKSMEHTT